MIPVADGYVISSCIQDGRPRGLGRGAKELLDFKPNTCIDWEFYGYIYIYNFYFLHFGELW